MEINEELLRKYIYHNQLLRLYNEALVEIYLEDYHYDEELKKYTDYVLKKSQKIIEIEQELLKKVNNVSRETNKRRDFK